jgi:hypothetical protein
VRADCTCHRTTHPTQHKPNGHTHGHVQRPQLS